VTRRSPLAVTAALLAALAASPAVAQPRPCADDARRLCPEVTPGAGAIAACLRPHFDQLSPDCQRQMQRVQKRQRALTGRRKQMRTARAAAGTPSPSPGRTAEPRP